MRKNPENKAKLSRPVAMKNVFVQGPLQNLRHNKLMLDMVSNLLFSKELVSVVRVAAHYSNAAITTSTCCFLP